MAFILFPDHLKMVASLYVMGGAFFVPGNVTALAEANFYGDPTSSNYILKFAHNLTITPLNATQFAILTPDIVDAISKNKKNIYAFMIAPVFEYYYEFYKKNQYQVFPERLFTIFLLLWLLIILLLLITYTMMQMWLKAEKQKECLILIIDQQVKQEKHELPSNFITKPL